MGPFNKLRVASFLILIGFMAVCVVAQETLADPWRLTVDGIAAIAAILAALRMQRWSVAEIDKERREQDDSP